jgi:glutaredoxin
MLPTLRRLEGTLNAFGLEFETVDIASEPSARRKMLEASGGENALPQLHADGVFLGPADELLELHDFGELIPMLLQQPAATSDLPEADESDGSHDSLSEDREETDKEALSELRDLLWGGTPYAHALMRHGNAWHEAQHICARLPQQSSSHPKKWCEFSGLDADRWQLTALEPAAAVALGFPRDCSASDSLCVIVAAVNLWCIICALPGGDT